MDHDTRLYLISPPDVPEAAAFLALLEQVLATGMVTAVQLRLKRPGEAQSDPGLLGALARDAVPLIQSAGAVAIINDLPDIAVETGADGVHLGQSDMRVKDARARLGPDALIGATCHASRHLAMEAGEAGADYVAFGAFYPTNTKDTEHRPDPDILAWWQDVMEIPCVAIGGIVPENAAPLIRAGVDFLAVSAGVWNHADGPVAAVKAFGEVIARTRGEAR